MRNREMVGKEIWNRLLKAEDGTLRNLYLATYSLDQGVLWWIADALSKNPQCTGEHPRISCVYDGARLRRWKRDVDDQAGGQRKFTCFSARTQKLYHPKVIIADCGSTWKALIGTGNLSSGESEQERNFGVLIGSAVSGSSAPNNVTENLRQLAGNIGLRPPKSAGAGGSATRSPEPSSCFLVVERSDGGYQVRCEQASLTKVFSRLLEKHVVPSDSSNDLCVVICSPFGISRKTFKDVFGGWEQNGRKIHLQLFTRKDVAPQSFPVEAYVHHPVGTAGLHNKLAFVAARDRNGATTEVTGDGILFLGSANFTREAWGKGKKNEENVETGVVIVDDAKKLKRAVEYLLDGRWSCRKIEKKKNADGTDDEDGDIDSEEEYCQLRNDALKRGLLAQCLEVKVNVDKQEVHVTKKEVNPRKGVRCRIKDVKLCNEKRGETVPASGNRIPIPHKIQDWTLKIRLGAPRNWPSEVEIPLCAVSGAEEFFNCDEDPLEKLLNPGGRCAVGGRGKRRQLAKSGESSDGAPSDDVRFPWDALFDLMRKGWKDLKHISEIENRLREEAERLAAMTHAKQSPENTGHRKREHTSGSASQHPPQRSYQKYQPYLRMYIIKKVLEAWQSSTKNGGVCRSQGT